MRRWPICRQAARLLPALVPFFGDALGLRAVNTAAHVIATRRSRRDHSFQYRDSRESTSKQPFLHGLKFGRRQSKATRCHLVANITGFYFDTRGALGTALPRSTLQVRPGVVPLVIADGRPRRASVRLTSDSILKQIALSDFAQSLRRG
jgi:hypothetical protein